MYGAFVLFIENVMFALIAFDTLYFKVDRKNQTAYEAAVAKPFNYQGRSKPIARIAHGFT